MMKSITILCVFSVMAITVATAEGGKPFRQVLTLEDFPKQTWGSYGSPFHYREIPGENLAIRFLYGILLTERFPVAKYMFAHKFFIKPTNGSVMPQADIVGKFTLVNIKDSAHNKDIPFKFTLSADEEGEFKAPYIGQLMQDELLDPKNGWLANEMFHSNMLTTIFEAKIIRKN